MAGAGAVILEHSAASAAAKSNQRGPIMQQRKFEVFRRGAGDHFVA